VVLELQDLVPMRFEERASMDDVSYRSQGGRTRCGEPKVSGVVCVPRTYGLVGEAPRGHLPCATQSGVVRSRQAAPGAGSVSFGAGAGMNCPAVGAPVLTLELRQVLDIVLIACQVVE